MEARTGVLEQASLTPRGVLTNLAVVDYTWFSQIEVNLGRCHLGIINGYQSPFLPEVFANRSSR